jgi:hypothetical protein
MSEEQLRMVRKIYKEKNATEIKGAKARELFLFLEATKDKMG